MKKYCYILLLSLMISCGNSFHLLKGDLLFQDLDSSPLCDAIELVTTGYNDANLSHIGLVISENGKLKVLEALPPKVKTTELKEFLNRSHDKNGKPKVIVGRLKDQYKHSIPNAIQFAKNQIETQYDEPFLIDNNKYYCSELIYKSFESDNIFTLKPMTFLDPVTNDTLDVWTKHYENIGIKLPQNEPGINPGDMSLSKKLEIIHIYGYPDGMEK